MFWTTEQGSCNYSYQVYLYKSLDEDEDQGSLLSVSLTGFFSTPANVIADSLRCPNSVAKTDTFCPLAAMMMITVMSVNVVPMKMPAIITENYIT